MITDHQLFGFMQALAANVRADKNGLILGEWEQNFLNSFTASSRPTLWFTEGRRSATDRMWRKYGAELNHPHPDDACAPSHTPIANVGCCEFLIRDENRKQVRCNADAEWQNRRGFLYCTPHKDEVQANLKRENKVMEVFPFVKNIKL